MTKKNRDYLAFFKSKDGNWSIIQFPNFILLAWIVLTILHMFIPNKGVSALASAVLFTWAYIELTKGDSQFRQAFGGIVLAMITYHYFF